jgi:rhamnose utilization protein RhaD (predicted bifunctional aldolase and dehydrogenase)/NAD(P)-dependent dehydrogenase (short-subunit alcohol dehydrogenase family)
VGHTLAVRNRWSDAEARSYESLLAQRVYSSRLLGVDPELVMHGGGNTSLKLTEPDVFGRPVDLLYVKGSGSDLSTMTERDFAPVRLDRLTELATLETLSDAEMAQQLRIATVRADAPAPSVEAILHACLPARFVDHTHADAVLTITNTPGGRKCIEELYGDEVVVIDYVMPGFALARLCAQEFPRQRTGATIGMVLMNHGIFSFGEDAKESYDRMIALVEKAEDYLKDQGAWALPTRDVTTGSHRIEIATVRAAASDLAGAPLIVESTQTPRVAAFVARSDYADLATRGPMTPDHVIRTKRLPLVDGDFGAYATAYEAMFRRLEPRSADSLTMLDPAPRLMFDPTLGLLSFGRSAKDASIARDLAVHTIDAIERAEALDSWQALPEEDLFDVEYWSLEQAKLAKSGALPPLTGDVALVTGAASGIGAATVAALLAAGAAVVGLDIDDGVTERFDHGAYLGLACDVTDDSALDDALERTVARFGGLDILVLNAGVFPQSKKITELGSDEWRRVMAVNVDANLSLLRLAGDLLALSPRYGRVVVNASKNVHAPGPGAAAYSASKAALTQLARVAAMEWASKGVRVNMLHPNAVFDTGIWDDATIASRASSYQLSVDEYKTNNLLGVEITSGDVARLIVTLCSPAFEKTTGAQIPIDGGTDRTL